MTSCLLSVFVCLLVVATGNAKSIIETLRNDYQPIVLSDCGPSPSIPVINAEPQIIPTIEKPPVNLPVDVPPPKVIGHTYHIYKLILRPQVFRQLITVPYLQRFVRTFQTPVLETIHIKQEVPF